MIILTNTNPEIDFFKNIRHLQLHRRTKALRMLSIVCAKGDLSQYSMMSFLLPLASHVVFCVPGEREHNLLLEAVNVIGGVASQLLSSIETLLKTATSSNRHTQEYNTVFNT